MMINEEVKKKIEEECTKSPMEKGEALVLGAGTGLVGGVISGGLKGGPRGAVISGATGALGGAVAAAVRVDKEESNCIQKKTDEAIQAQPTPQAQPTTQTQPPAQTPVVFTSKAPRQIVVNVPVGANAAVAMRMGGNRVAGIGYGRRF
jgi:hypothetical protein